MAFEYVIEIQSPFSYQMFLEELLVAFHGHRLTAEAIVVDNELVLPNDSSWGRWFELSEYQNGLLFWVTAHQREQEELIRIIDSALKKMGISSYCIKECED